MMGPGWATKFQGSQLPKSELADPEQFSLCLTSAASAWREPLGELVQPPYDENPNGYVAFPPTGRIFAFVTADNREMSQTPEDQSAAFRSMIVVSGKYRREGDEFIIKVDWSGMKDGSA
jgi:hypothetical protein